MIPEINTIDTTTVTISKNALKCSTGDWLIYDRNWLLDNLDTEVKVLHMAKEHKDRIENKLRGEKERKTGKWKRVHNHVWECTTEGCGMMVSIRTPYCAYCGAKMEVKKCR